MLYVILALYVVQAFVVVYLVFTLRDIDKRLNDLEDHLFDV